MSYTESIVYIRKKNVHDNTSHTSVLSAIDDKSRQYSDIATRTMTNLKDRSIKISQLRDQ
jgi:hypothetical protein